MLSDLVKYGQQVVKRCEDFVLVLKPQSPLAFDKCICQVTRSWSGVTLSTFMNYSLSSCRLQGPFDCLTKVGFCMKNWKHISHEKKTLSKDSCHLYLTPRE